MALHNWYKCDHCPIFHPVETDMFLKVQIYISVQTFASDEANNNIPINYLRYTLLKRILQTNTPRKLRQLFQKLDRNLERFQATIRTWNPAEKEDYFGESQNFACSHHVVKCIKTKQGVCAGELERAFRGTPLDWFCQVFKLFAREPSKQWMEIDGLKMHVKPLWFAENRVYQFHAKLVAVRTGNKHSRRFDCKKLVDGELKKILTFDLHFDENWPSCPEGSFRTKLAKAWILKWQTDSNNFESAITGNPPLPQLLPLILLYQN